MLRFANELKNDQIFILQINIDGVKNFNFIEISLNYARIIPLSPYIPFNFVGIYRLDFIQWSRKSKFSIKKFNKSNIMKKVTNMRTLKLDFCSSLIQSTIVIIFKTLYNMFRENWTWYKRCNIKFKFSIRK